MYSLVNHRPHIRTGIPLLANPHTHASFHIFVVSLFACLHASYPLPVLYLFRSSVYHGLSIPLRSFIVVDLDRVVLRGFCCICCDICWGALRSSKLKPWRRVVVERITGQTEQQVTDNALYIAQIRNQRDDWDPHIDEQREPVPTLHVSCHQEARKKVRNGVA
jgi:hypothetical protein